LTTQIATERSDTSNAVYSFIAVSPGWPPPPFYGELGT
jgi:hypothetical protein